MRSNWFTVIGLIWLQSDLRHPFFWNARLPGRLPRPNLTIPAIAALIVALPGDRRGDRRPPPIE